MNNGEPIDNTILLHVYLAPGDYLNASVPMALSRRRCTNIVIVDDDIPERTEKFELHLSSKDPHVKLGDRFNSNTSSVTIRDDDGMFTAIVLSSD